MVALHGCTQTAEEYDYGAGWSSLADDLGFAIVSAAAERLIRRIASRGFCWATPQEARGASVDQANGRARDGDLWQ
jgi:poly(3-hydroxybutyrate) depolymerase